MSQEYLVKTVEYRDSKKKSRSQVQEANAAIAGSLPAQQRILGLKEVIKIAGLIGSVAAAALANTRYR